MVDVLLCHHHYRLSQPRLAELDALCINASPEPLNEPESVGSLPGPGERA